MPKMVIGAAALIAVAAAMIALTGAQQPAPEPEAGVSRP